MTTNPGESVHPSPGAGGLDRRRFLTLGGASNQAVLVTVTPTPDWAMAVGLRTQAGCTVASDLACQAGGFHERYINKKSLAPGTYDAALGEQYPLVMPPQVRIVGDQGSAVTFLA